jgi:hypothetical protein
MKRTEMQLRTRSKLISTKEGQALGFGFRLGPLTIYVIANLPEKGGNPEGPLVYIKMDLRPADEFGQEWTETPDSGR